MWKYVARRLLIGIPTLIGASVVVFVVMRVAPGDVALLLVGGGVGGEGIVTNPERVQAIRRELGLDKPLALQYGLWIRDFFRGEWGQSLWSKQPVTDLLARRYPVTLELALLAMAFSFIIAIPGGILAAVKQDTLIDHAARVLASLGLAIPHFWLGIMILYFLAAYTGWIPSMSFATPWENPGRNLSQFIFPALVVGSGQSAILTRMMRSTLLEVIREDYIRTARAKGLSNAIVLQRHALKNALIPVITVAGVNLGHLLTGALVTEVVFNLPGLGQALVEGVQNRDYPVVQTIILLSVLGVLVVNIAVDLVYAWLNPRVRYD